MLSSEDVQDILALLDSLPYGEFTLQTSRFSLRLRRTADGMWTQETTVLAEAAPIAGGQDVTGPAPEAMPAPDAEPATGLAAADPVSDPAESGLAEIRAPLLGTFYRAPQPGAPPFVKVGSEVGQDTVVAIVETMKLMNPVYAGMAGTVAEICLSDGEFAEQDTVLMLVRPAAG